MCKVSVPLRKATIITDSAIRQVLITVQRKATAPSV